MASDGAIATERLVLRPLKVEDAPELLAINECDEVRKQLYEPVYMHADSDAWKAK
jgi:RimJ/RimL family protein N-acetyltransferase